MSTDLTEALIKHKARSFDLESILWLDLSRCGGWVQLQQLQLEGNRISDLSAAGIDQLQKKAPTLTIISLSNREGVSNPICSSSTYRTSMLTLLPHLSQLDGERLPLSVTATATAAAPSAAATFAEQVRSFEAQTDKWSPRAGAQQQQQQMQLSQQQQESKLAERKQEDWLAGVANPPIPSTAAIDKALAPTVTGFRNTLKECAKLASDDADSLIAELEKKYAAAIAKEKRDSSSLQTTDALADANKQKKQAGDFGFDQDED